MDCKLAWWPPGGALGSGLGLSRRSALGPGLVLGLSLASAACVDVGREAVEVPLYAGGSEIDEAIPGKAGATIELDRAELAFGPLYLCAGVEAGELCETARLEWLEAEIVDVLEPAPSELGTLSGTDGRVRSWMYDLGIVSLLTKPEPTVLPAAEQLGDTSLVLEGRAILDGLTIPFAASVAIQQEEETELGVPVVRKSSTEVFDHEILLGEPGLLIRFDPRPWVAEIDFAAVLEDQSCEPGGPPIVCADQLEQSCAADGTVTDTRDCGTLGQICVRDLGCVELVEFAPDSQGYRAIRNQVVAGPRPSFEWGFEP